MARYEMDVESTHPHLVLCSAPEEKIEKLIDKLEFRGIKFSLFREPDIGNQMTAIATVPLKGKDRKLFKGFKLLGKEECMT